MMRNRPPKCALLVVTLPRQSQTWAFLSRFTVRKFCYYSKRPFSHLQVPACAHGHLHCVLLVVVLTITYLERSLGAPYRGGHLPYSGPQCIHTIRLFGRFCRSYGESASMARIDKKWKPGQRPHPLTPREPLMSKLQMSRDHCTATLPHCHITTLPTTHCRPPSYQGNRPYRWRYIFGSR